MSKIEAFLNQKVDQTKIKPVFAIGIILVAGFVLLAAISWSIDDGLNRYEEKRIRGGIENNLRQIASAAEQYFSDSEEASVCVTKLIEEGYFNGFESFAGEDYSSIQVNKGFTHIRVSTPDGLFYAYVVKERGI